MSAPLTQATINRICAAYRAGHSDREIAAAHGLSQTCISKVRKRMGVPTRTPTESGWAQRERRLAREAARA